MILMSQKLEQLGFSYHDGIVSIIGLEESDNV
jgi:hypothetical protein